MAKRKNQQVRKAAIKITYTPEQLAANAERFVHEQNYKKAIDNYKSLIKVDEHPKWSAALGECYRLRAHQLADKQMYVEALASFDNAQQLTGVGGDIETVIGWLLHSKNWSRIAQFYQQHQNDKMVIQRLAPPIALQAMIGNKKVTEHIDPQSPLWQHCLIARKALNAWSESKDTEAGEWLKQLPYRSAYKDFSTVMKALLSIDTDCNKAQHLLQSVNQQSVFHGFAHDLLAMYRFNDEDQQELLTKTYVTVPLATLKGWSNAAVTKWKNAYNYVRSPDPKLAISLLNSVKTTLTPIKYQQQLAAIYYIDDARFDDKRFNELSHLERCRLRALNATKEKEVGWLIECWEFFIDEMGSSLNLKSEQCRHAIAAAYLYLADQIKSQHPPSYIKFLKESLDMVPSEAVYQQLFDLEQRYQIKDLNKVTEQAIKAFPNNLTFLKQAMAAATKQQSFKKAAQLAKRILKRDPVNQSAKRVLINSHLSQGHKLLKKGDIGGIEKELAQALSYDPAAHQLSRYYMLQALKCWTQSDKQQIHHWLSQAMSTLQSPLAVRLGLLTNGQIINLTSAAISRQLGPIAKVSDIEEVKQLLSFACHLQDIDFTIDDLTLKPFNALIKKSLSQCDDHHTVTACCHFLYQLNTHKLLETVSNTQAKRFVSQQPLMLEFYNIYAAAQGDPHNVTASYYQRGNVFRLQNLSRKAQSLDDTAAQGIILSFLAQVESCLTMKFEPDSMWDDDDDDYDDDDYDDYDDDDDEQLEIERKLFDMLGEIEQMLKNGGSPQKAKKMLEEMGIDPSNIPF